MKADLKAKWIAALRSGEYQQGHGVLRSGDHYCCLGVLCEVAGIPSEDGRYTFGIDGTSCIGLRGELDAEVGRFSTRLAHKNDGGESFAEIANYIEQNIPTEGDAA